MIFLIIAMALQIPTTTTPRAAKSGEERTSFTKNGKSCGILVHNDAFWYFYLASSKDEPHGWFSKGFDTRAEAVKWGSPKCPNQGKVTVTK